MTSAQLPVSVYKEMAVVIGTLILPLPFRFGGIIGIACLRFYLQVSIDTTYDLGRRRKLQPRQVFIGKVLRAVVSFLYHTLRPHVLRSYLIRITHASTRFAQFQFTTPVFVVDKADTVPQFRLIVADFILAHSRSQRAVPTCSRYIRPKHRRIQTALCRAANLSLFHLRCFCLSASVGRGGTLSLQCESQQEAGYKRKILFHNLNDL